MTNIQMKLGCFGLFVIVALGFLFAKFLVPIFPLVVGLLVFYTSNKFRATVFKSPQNINSLTEGQVLLEGKVCKLNGELTSPYFKEDCIGYIYNLIEFVPNDDGYYNDLKLTRSECVDFTLSTKSGEIEIIGNQLDLKQIEPLKQPVHSLKPQINDISHQEHLLKNGDEIVLVGNFVKNIFQRLEITKLGNEPFFVTTRNKIEAQRTSYQVLKSLFPWMIVIYIVVNYFLFFAPSNNMPKSDLFAFLAFFGLPIMFVVFWLLGKDKKDWLSQIFQYLAGVCILSSLLTFPLLVLLYMIEIEYYRIYCIVISIISITAFGLNFNYRKLLEYNSLTEKLVGKNTNVDGLENEDEELY